MHYLRKITRIIMPVLILVVICFLTNATINQHMHKLSSGIIIKHSHPFNNNNAGNPFQEHNHTSAELVFLDQMSNTFFWIYLFILLLNCLFVGYKINIRYYGITFCNPDLYFLKNYRAPPCQIY